MRLSSSRGENPRNPDPDQSPALDLGANSSSPTARSVETSLGLGFQSTSASPPPLTLRRSLRLSALSSNAQSPPPAVRANPASAEASLEIGFQSNSAPQPSQPLVRRCPVMCTGASAGMWDRKLVRAPLSMRGEPVSKRKRGRPPKGIKVGANNEDESVARRTLSLTIGKEIYKEVQVVDVEDDENDKKEEDMLGGDNVANGDGPGTVKFTDSQSGGVEIVGEDEDDELVILRVTKRCIDKGKGKLIVDEKFPGESEGAARKREKLSYKDKGKRKLIVNLDSEPEPVKVSKFKELVNISDSDSGDLTEMVKNAVLSLSSPAFHVPMRPLHAEVPVRAPISLREAQKMKAIELAPEFARFTNEKGDETEKDDESMPNGPGPFTEAMKKTEERADRLGTGQAGSTIGGKPGGVRISWSPSNKGKGLFRKPQCRLKHLSVKALAENAEEIQTLVNIPYPMRSKLSFMLCHTNKMNMHHLSKLMEGSPTELRLSNCTWASDKDFEDAFAKCDKSNLEVQLVYVL